MEVSQLYETEPMYIVNQPRFLNAVAAGYTDFTCHRLLNTIQDIERQLGRCRRREIRKGPRVIDIDILLFGDTVMDSDELTIPHPKMGERQFVLVPLLDLSPDLVDPVTAQPLKKRLKKLEGQGIYTYRAAQYNWNTID
jgi:2-amino-4-hydroxy-6-hydroxymethyldihydropteridine diphosphokinase